MHGLTEGRSVSLPKDEFQFKSDAMNSAASIEKSANIERWKVLIVDDDESVHQVTRLVLGDMQILGAELELFHVYSGKQACQFMERHPDVAVMLLDVMMETPHAGLDTVDYIRKNLANKFVRIILRTGHPGDMFETDVISRYDINDYKEKSELTDQKLKTALISAIRGYRDLHMITALMNSNQTLDNMVRERTLELEYANKKLRKEIDERIKSEALKERESRKLHRLQTILDSTLDMIGVFDPETYCFSYVNQGATLMTGYSRDELLGMESFALMPTISKSKFKSEYLQPLLDNQTCAICFETTQVRRDGEEVAVDVLLQHVEDGESSSFVCIIRDISERKRLERMKAEFVSTVSHELRTPLTSINGVLKLLNAGMLGELTAKSKEMVHIACTNTDRLSRLVDDLLDAERIRSGKMIFRFKPGDLVAIVKQAICNNQAYGARLHVRYQLIEAPSSAMVLIDADRIGQVLDNLLSNAAKYSPEGADVDVAVMSTERGYRVEVVDRGSGIPPEFVDRIFERFSQADSSTTRKVGGTGLGLNISKSIIEKHGGTLDFRSTPGVRTCFFFELDHLEHAKAKTTGVDEKKRGGINSVSK